MNLSSSRSLSQTIWRVAMTRCCHSNTCLIRANHHALDNHRLFIVQEGVSVRCHLFLSSNTYNLSLIRLCNWIQNYQLCTNYHRFDVPFVFVTFYHNEQSKMTKGHPFKRARAQDYIGTCRVFVLCSQAVSLTGCKMTGCIQSGLREPAVLKSARWWIYYNIL